MQAGACCVVDVIQVQLLVLQWYGSREALAFDLFLLWLWFAVVNEGKDKAPIFHFRWRAFDFLGILPASPRYFHIHVFCCSWDPPDDVENNCQVGEGRRQERARVEELYRQIESCISEIGFLQWVECGARRVSWII